MPRSDGTDNRRFRLLAIGGAVSGIAIVLWMIPVGAYPWMKAFHVISVIAWMAGLLYLPRLFVYHAEAGNGTPQAETFKIMERRLLVAIMWPAMIASWVFGLWIAWRVFGFAGGWLHAKLALVVALSGLHIYLAIAQRRFAEDRNERSSRHWRFLNEAPAVLMIGIVIFAVVKPF